MCVIVLSSVGCQVKDTTGEDTVRLECIVAIPFDINNVARRQPSPDETKALLEAVLRASSSEKVRLSASKVLSDDGSSSDRHWGVVAHFVETSCPDVNIPGTSL
jgi:hypothetical protein